MPSVVTLCGVDDLLANLSALYPPDRLLIDPAHLAAYESDALTAFHVLPRAIVIPETIEEIINTVRFCAEHEIPFVARGSGTSLSGGSLPIKDGLVIALNRLNRIVDMKPDDRIAVVEPGVLNLQVSEAALPFGLHYAPDPSSQQVCTIGGNVAFNSGGAHCLKYGMTSNHVLGLKAVLATGEVVEFGGASREQIGPDTTGLFVGCEGLFGVALEITLRLVPRAECFHTVLAGYETLEAAGDAVAAVVASGLLPGAMEIMDRLAIEAAEASVSCGYPENAEAVMIVELEGPEEEVVVDREKLMSLIDESKPQEMRIARDETERMMIWKGRKSAFSAVGRLSPDFIVQDGVVPRKRLGEALRNINDMSKETGIRVANVFHAGDGNLHPLILYDGREKGALQRAEELAARILRMCIEMGGSITGEHGIGVEKREFLPEQFSEDDIDTMKKIRRAFDPAEIANRGKMFPSSDASSLTMTGLHPLEEAGVISRE